MEKVIDSPGSEQEEEQQLTTLPVYVASEKSGANDTAVFRSKQSQSIQRDAESPEMLCFSNGAKRQSMPVVQTGK